MVEFISVTGTAINFGDAGTSKASGSLALCLRETSCTTSLH